MNFPRSARRAACFALILGSFVAAATAAEPAPKWDPASTATPEGVGELQALQTALKAAVEKCTPATVALKYSGDDAEGLSTGSGVIVNPDGLILTAAHVIRDYDPNHKGRGDPSPLPYTGGKDVTVMLADGSEVKGKTLGINGFVDSGMVQITEKPKDSKYFKDGKWVFRPVAKSADVKKSQWVLSMGHPDGPKVGRAPVARLGRVLEKGKDIFGKPLIRTDCTIVGGDSGGPLFDLAGNVIGIHSRMVLPYTLAHNIHVPLDDFTKDWDKMLAGEWVDKPQPRPGNAYFGVVFPEDENEDAWISDVEQKGPADAAGLKPGDTITKFNDTAVKSVKEFRKLMAGARANDVVTITARRGTEIKTFKVTLTKRS
jgi:serine protease Do